MRKKTKLSIQELLNNYTEFHNNIEKAYSVMERQACLDMLSACQEGMISIGNMLEGSDLDSSASRQAVHFIEDYCEHIFEVYEFVNNSGTEDTNWQLFLSRMQILRDGLLLINSEVEKIPVTYHIVFMPYKAAMWDSLESVWRAAKADKMCQCLVVPIPYFEYNTASKDVDPKYDGALFPDYVEITDYHEYSMEKELPDVIYIHNPFDGANHMTSVHPSFYSDKLKKYTDKLVYIPYYASSGFCSPEYLELPSNYNVDYVIAQSQHFKDYAADYPFYDKYIPLGSPKFDKVIEACRKHDIKDYPDDWRRRLAGRKVIMLNTSIGMMLNDTEQYLGKLRLVFDYFATRSDVTLIWRPHPLLLSSLKAMRAEYAVQYEELVMYFKQHDIGIFDDTPDMEKTIAACDAYIGETTSSVINMFQVAGKPLFILNNSIFREFTSSEIRRIGFTNIYLHNDEQYVFCSLDVFMCHSSNLLDLDFIAKISDEPHWCGTFGKSIRVRDRIYPAPLMSKRAYYFDLCKKKFYPLEGFESDKDFKLQYVMQYGDRLFYLPGHSGAVYEYSLSSGTLFKYDECIEELLKFSLQKSYNSEIGGYAVYEHYLYMTATYCNRVLKLDMDDGSYELLHLTDEVEGFGAVVVVNSRLYLSDASNGSIYSYALNDFGEPDGELSIIHMPDSFNPWENPYGVDAAHSALISMGRYIVAFPAYSNEIVRIDTTIGEVKTIFTGLFEIPDERINGLKRKCFYNIMNFEKLSDEEILVLRVWDAAALRLNIADETYDIYNQRMTPKALEDLLSGEDGFEKADIDAEFSRKESSFFSLDSFVDDLVSGRLEDIKERQMSELSVMGANLDGSCGRKVHEFVMGKLTD